ncbi:MAG: NAD(+)/NADH kinase, partial [Planctomycetota bacterium]
MKRVLLVYKRSFIERHRNEPGLLARMSAPERRRMRTVHLNNRRAIQRIQEELRRRDIQFDVVHRDVVDIRDGYDLVITVGGDGTFFRASHAVGATPILGVNSHPDHSLGLHCGADPVTFPRVLTRVLSGRAKVTRLNRLSLEINGRRFPMSVLNDVLFAIPSPAAMSCYTLSIDGGGAERQRSSGVWVSTAAGSTAAIYAAGGRRMPLSSTRVQYL